MELTKNCTGCMACYNTCPSNAIKIVFNEEGFYIPKIDNNKCIDCGLCNSVCPQIRTTFRKEEPSVCYAVMADNEIRKNSASGGLFALIAQEYLRNGGYVCGAAFSKDFRCVNHIIINDEKDLIRLQNSKYVQSNIGNTFSEIRILLENGKEVLFSGTPCQVAGLNSYLKKNYDNLLTMDLVCHGIPSPLVWEKYISEIAGNKQIKKLSFRNKDKEWGSPYELLVLFKNNSKFKEQCSSNIFYRSFFEHLILNEPCYNCKYTNLSRQGDITIGDFWGINNFDTDLDDGLGTSLVIINSVKGEKIVKKNYDNLKKIKEIPINYAINFNPRLKTPSERNLKNNIFLANLDKKTIIKNMKENLVPKYEGIICNYWNIPNFGATLSAYAIQQYFFKHGKYYYLLKTKASPAFVDEFAKKFLKTTHIVKSKLHLLELNKSTNNFVIGTDQVLREDFVIKDLTKSLLGYTNFNKKRVVFSGSFGNDKLFILNNIEKLLYSKYIKRFDAISTREISGKDICKNEFGLNAEYIIDPVFLVNKEIWDNMAANTGDKYKGKIVTYLFYVNSETNKMLKYLEKKYNKKIVALENGKISPEEFLSGIKNADYVVTNSFHGMCFSLIFNKKVLCIKSITSGRFNSLIKLFNITNLFVNNYNEIYSKNDLFSEYDKNNIEKVINQERLKAEKWFDKAINKKKQISIRKILVEIDYKVFLSIEYVLKFIINRYINLKFLFFCYMTKKKVVFWGASLYLADLLKKNPKISQNILGIIDNNPTRHYKKFFGCTIYPPEKIIDLKPKIVISTVKNNHKEVYNEIKNYLQATCPNVKLLRDIFE